MTTEKIEKYDYQIQIVLGILGSPCEEISDETDVGDIIESGDPSQDVARVAELADIFNMKASLNTKLWELAKAICFEELVEPNEDET